MSIDPLDLYRRLAEINEVDVKVRASIRSGRIPATYFPMRGLEAIAAGVAAALRQDDYVVTTYRGMHDQIAKGVPIREIVAEMAGRQCGSSGGKGGAMHVTCPEVGLMFTTGIVGGGLPVGVGLALAAQHAGRGQVAVVNFGDGASNTGSFHESVNLAAVWNVPVVFVCQNNAIAEMTPYPETTRAAQVADRAAAYVVPATAVDGNDPVAVYEAVADAVGRCRAGEGPALVECHTVRPYGHHVGDDTGFLDEELQAKAREQAPRATFRKRLLAEGVATDEQLDTIDGEIAENVAAELEAAIASPPASVEFALAGVYSDDTKGAAAQ